MLLNLLEKNKSRVASAAAEEIAKAHAKGLPAYVEDPDVEGAVVQHNPDGSHKKLVKKNDNAA